jgi:hypothetical protein
MSRALRRAPRVPQTARWSGKGRRLRRSPGPRARRRQPVPRRRAAPLPRLVRRFRAVRRRVRRPLRRGRPASPVGVPPPFSLALPRTTQRLRVARRSRAAQRRRGPPRRRLLRRRLRRRPRGGRPRGPLLPPMSPALRRAPQAARAAWRSPLVRRLRVARRSPEALRPRAAQRFRRMVIRPPLPVAAPPVFRALGSRLSADRRRARPGARSPLGRAGRARTAGGRFRSRVTRRPRCATAPTTRARVRGRRPGGGCGTRTVLAWPGRSRVRGTWSSGSRTSRSCWRCP